jgi:hypothetical protein
MTGQVGSQRRPRPARPFIVARMWKWLRSYRRWLAHRKVFLWPENWLTARGRRGRRP